MKNIVVTNVLYQHNVCSGYYLLSGYLNTIAAEAKKKKLQKLLNMSGGMILCRIFYKAINEKSIGRLSKTN